MSDCSAKEIDSGLRPYAMIPPFAAGTVEPGAPRLLLSALEWATVPAGEQDPRGFCFPELASLLRRHLHDPGRGERREDEAHTAERVELSGASLTRKQGSQTTGAAALTQAPDARRARLRDCIRDPNPSSRRVGSLSARKPSPPCYTMKTVTYDEVYSPRGPRFFNHHPMSVASLMSQGVAIPAWRSSQAELAEAPVEEENDQVAFLRLVMGEP